LAGTDGSGLIATCGAKLLLIALLVSSGSISRSTEGTPTGGGGAGGVVGGGGAVPVDPASDPPPQAERISAIAPTDDERKKFIEHLNVHNDQLIKILRAQKLFIQRQLVDCAAYSSPL
jgi:hypothetical protein